MKKILALDLGDQWVGIAISDPSFTFARPYETVKKYDLERYLQELFKKEEIEAVVVGYPKTMRGTESDQTKKVVDQKEDLEKKFQTTTWLLWDERLSSKRAGEGRGSSKEDKLKSHARAAAYILDSYLSFLQNQKNN